MPTYQYACTNPDCGNQFELVQSFTDPAASECPVCNGRVRKVYGSVGVVFKGSGFYRTDNRADAKKAPSSTPSGSKESSSSSSSETSSSGSASADSSSTSSAASSSSTSSPSKAAAPA